MGLDAAIAKASGEEYGFKDAVKSFAGGFVAGLIGAGAVNKIKKAIKAYRATKQANKVTSLLNKAKFTDTTKKGGKLTDQYNRAGGFKQANKDFDKLTKGLKVIREVKSKGVIRRTTLKSGEKINVRNYSKGKAGKEGSPTLEIVPKSGNKIKIRYK